MRISSSCIVVAILIGVLAPAPSHGQPGATKVAASTKQAPSTSWAFTYYLDNALLRKGSTVVPELTGKLTDSLQKKLHRADFIVVPEAWSYGYECGNLKTRHIGWVPATFFAKCKLELGNSAPIPIRIVRRPNRPKAYYAAQFVVRKDSKVTYEAMMNRDFRLFLVHPTSGSGFVAPLIKLDQMGVISVPTTGGLDDERIEWKAVGSQSAVEDSVRNDRSGKAVGAVADYSDAQTLNDKDLVVLARYGSLVEDVVYVSTDLAEDSAGIASALRSLADTLCSNPCMLPVFVGGIEPLANEYKMALNVLEAATKASGNAETTLERVRLWLIRAVRDHTVEAGFVVMALFVAPLLIGAILGRFYEPGKLVRSGAIVLVVVLLLTTLMRGRALPYFNAVLAIWVPMVLALILGLLGRTVFNMVSHADVAAPVGNVYDRFGAGMVIIVGIALLYHVGGYVLYGAKPTSDSPDANQRAAITLALAALTTGLLLEQVGKLLLDALKKFTSGLLGGKSRGGDKD